MFSKYILTFLLYTVLFFSQKIFAQNLNINGFEIFVSKDVTNLFFHSEVKIFYFDERENCPYKILTVGNDGIAVYCPDKYETVAKPYTLNVQEGGRKHRFVILYKDKKDIEYAEREKNFSDLKQLEKSIKDFSNKPTVQNSQNNPSANNQILNPSNQEKKADNNILYVLIADGDKAKKNQQLEEAKTKYEQALQIDPDNSYVQTMLQEVKNLIEKAKDANYTGIITKANNAYNLNKFDEAIQYYNEALTIKPDDLYANSQLQLIQQKAAAAKIDEANRQKDSLYNSYIKAGDKAFKEKFYEAAQNPYTEALKIKPGDPYVNKQLQLIQQESAAAKINEVNRQKDSLYNSYIKAGDKAFKEKSYDAAKNSYTEASKIKPGDPYVNSQLQLIQQKIATAKIDEADRQKDSLYDSYIKAGNKAFDDKFYDIAKNSYAEALKIKPGDPYANIQLNLIQQRLAAAKIDEANRQKDSLYNNYIKTGDKAFNAKSFDSAKIAYNEALKIQAGDIYATGQLQLIQQKIAIAKIDDTNRRQDSLYKNFIKFGDKAFNAKSFDSAKNAYNQALKIKPNDSYAVSQAQKADSLLQNLQAQQELSLQKNEEADDKRPDVKAAREIEYNMLKIKEHKFKMGNDVGSTDESPVHIVAIDPFYMARYEVTQSQWQRIMGSNPSVFKNCDSCPVENISWDDAMEFIQKLNAISNKKYRLPTEAEWEFAARSQSSKEKLDNIAWYNDNSKSTHPVGRLRPNSLGIYDMLGNVAEWCSDWYDAGYYNKNESLENPAGPISGRGKVIRGGCWYDMGLRVTERDKKPKTERNKKTGIRLALNAD